MPLPSVLTETTQAHLEQLLLERAQEGAHLEFKRELPNVWDSTTKPEFLADVTAFANSGGGELIFGIEQAADGAASALVPQSNPSIDQELLRMQNFLTDSVEPRLPGVQLFPVPASVNGTAGHVVIVRIPQSWVGPHRVISNRHFYIRDNGSKRPVNVPELRSLFLQSDSQAKRIRDFRTERLGRVLTGETPYRLVDGPTVVLHIVPVQAALGRVEVDPVQYNLLRRQMPVVASGTAVVAKLNLDGAVGSRNPTPQGTNGYTTFYRNGFIEATWVLGPRQDGGTSGSAVLPSGVFEGYLANFTTAARAEMAHWGVAQDAIVMLSLVGADETTLRHQRSFADIDTGRFDRKVLALPDVQLSGELPALQEMRALFDLVWQSAGFEGSPNYDAQGNWAPPQN